MANVPRWASRSMWGGSVYKTARCSGLRSYSSTPLKSALGTLYTACQRVMDNTNRLAKYEKELQLFPADTNPASLWWTMVQLHMPQKTELELVEFLEGAKMAAKTQLKAVNSKEFAEFAAGLINESKVADELSYYCTPRFFENLKEAAASTLKDRNMTLELQDINIESIVVADVRTRSLETTKMTLIGQEKCFALQDNSRTWTFGSKVGSFEELEWRIVNTVGANNAAKQLSRTVYADQVDDGNDMSLEDEQKL
ncbi:hypothetical protein PC120_g14891 [Phytophthora cactorum]|nr:hypothetical protein PC120_g14891 [Phytophthora cactorum]